MNFDRPSDLRERLDEKERTWTAGVAANMLVLKKGQGWEVMRNFHDRALLDLFREVMGMGSVSGPYGPSGTYRWRTPLHPKKIDEMLAVWHGWLEPNVRDQLVEVKQTLEARRAGRELVGALAQAQRQLQMENYADAVEREAERVG